MREKKWARVGMTFEVDMELWNKDNEKAIMEAFKTGHARLDGETYFPEEADENSGEEQDLDLTGVVTLMAQEK